MTKYSGSFAKNGLSALAACGCLAVLSQAAAQESRTESGDAFETKHIFGFTEGTDVGEVGGRELEFTTNANIGKRGGGRYQALRQEATYEAAPTSRFGYEATLHGVSQQIGDVTGLGNLNQTTFSGIAATPKWLLLARGVDAPFGLAVTAQPQWDRIDPVTGARANDFEVETRWLLDAELIEKKLYGAANLIFSPEIQYETGEGVSHYALFGATAALTWRFTQTLALGGEIERYETYDSLGFSRTVGSATFLGPTLHWQVTPEAFVALAWSAQVASRIASNTPAALALYNQYNQSDISRQRGRLTFSVAF